MEIEALAHTREKEYTEFISNQEHALFNSSLMFRDLLYKTVIRGCYFSGMDNYLVAIENDQIVGTLPVFLTRNGKYGNVVNSLPWYGSNPGIITSAKGEKALKIKTKLIEAFYDFAELYDAATATIITRPFEGVRPYFDYVENIDEHGENTYFDTRIGMITELPSCSKELMTMYHSKTRNLVRKAQKSGINVYESKNIDDLLFVADLHRENMKAIGGPPKPKKLFLDLNDVAVIGKDFKVYIAEKDGNKIAGLILKYFNKTIDYMTPAIKVEYRACQPLNLIIYEAMQDAIYYGYKYWNWGGTTLPQQKSVYHYKKRWGTKQCTYLYLTKVFDKSILELDKETILQEYPYFYVVPFNGLKKG